MDRRQAEKLLRAVASGKATVDEALDSMKLDIVSDLGYAKVDHRRGLLQGVSEVIYGEGKTANQILGICQSMLDSGQSCILVTRLDADKAGIIAESFKIDYHPIPRVGIIGSIPEPDGNGSVVVACAGTSDLFVAEEAALTAEVLGNEVVRLYDVGVAGIHRLLSHAPQIADANVVVAAAGMEGALPSVIAGLASCPVIAVPTSVGYGASLGGIAALLSMLNSCSSGISVVNIDNGFGAGYQASMINHAKASRRPPACEEGI